MSFRPLVKTVINVNFFPLDSRRKEVNTLRGTGSGNEAKNERLKVKWLASAVTELKAEVAEVLGARNASEEFAQRSRMRSELELLRGDVAQVGRGIRDLGGRLAKIEASLGTIRLDIFAVKERAGQLTRICADVTSQVVIFSPLSSRRSISTREKSFNSLTTRAKFFVPRNRVNRQTHKFLINFLFSFFFYLSRTKNCRTF